MGSHYIPVGKLKIDKELLDIACPAAGYGETPPDPAAYCPANGYYPSDDNTPDIPIPDVVAQSIVFICNADSGGFWTALDWLVINSTADCLYEVFNSSGNLVHSESSTLGYVDLTSIIAGLSGYFSVRVSTVGSITSMKRLANIVDNTIVEAIIANTPDVESLYQFQYKCSKLVSCKFECTLNMLTEMSSAFRESGIERFTFPVSMPALTDLSYTFMQSRIRSIDLSNTVVPALTNMNRIASHCVYLSDFKFPGNLPECTNLLGALDNTIRLVEVVLPLTWPKLEDIDYLLSTSGFESELEFPDIPATCDNLFRIFQKSAQVKSIKFNAGHSNLNVQDAFNSMLSLEYIEMPRVIKDSASPAFDNDTDMKIYIGPDVGFVNLPVGSSKLESMTGEHDSPTTTFVNCTANQNTLHTFDCKYLKARYFRVGGYSSYQHYSLLTHINIDWANSPFDYSSSTYNPALRINAELDAAELNRIMGLLPTVTDTKHIDFRYCPGYATCDPTIAEAKGWTVI